MAHNTFKNALHNGISPSQRRNRVLKEVIEQVAAGKPSYHSKAGSTLCAVLYGLEEAGVQYRLTAGSGGYEVQALTATSK
jgi:hypothetical protein